MELATDTATRMKMLRMTTTMLPITMTMVTLQLSLLLSMMTMTSLQLLKLLSKMMMTTINQSVKFIIGEKIHMSRFTETKRKWLVKMTTLEYLDIIIEIYLLRNNLLFQFNLS